MTPPPAQLLNARHYAVFISYRHADNLELGRKWATWLHEAIESYEVPADLIGKPNLRGEPIPATLFPVFRDEEELPADADLTNNIQRALENSGLLVVICSPRAVQSRFVADEIRYFKEIGRSSKILALVIDGEPNASDDPEKAARLGSDLECFPEPLRFGVPDASGKVDWSKRTEPIAADCRPGGRPEQGWTHVAAFREWLDAHSQLPRSERQREVKEYAARLELAKLKVIAGALGVPLGELTKRDQARQLRRAKQRARLLTSLVSGFALLSGFAAFQAYQASQQRGKALHAQAIAEDQRQLAESNLATAQFQEGTRFLIDPLRAREGLPLLAQATRNGHVAAATRLWLLTQQSSFWLASKPADQPLPTPTRQAIHSPIPKHLSLQAIDDQSLPTSWFSSSPDGKRWIVAINHESDDGQRIHRFRFGSHQTTELSPWREVQFDGTHFLDSLVGAVFSPDGRFAAIIAQAWREPQFIEIWDLNSQKRVGTAIHAQGLQPNEQGGVFNEVRFLPGNPNVGPLLLTLSSRGEAQLFQLDASSESASFWNLKSHQHSKAASLAAVSLTHDRFASYSEDGSLLVSSISGNDAPAWPIHHHEPLQALHVESPQRLLATDLTNSPLAWDFLPAPSPRLLPKDAQFTQTQVAGLQPNFETSSDSDVSATWPKTLSHSTAGQLLQTKERELQFVSTSGSIQNFSTSAPILFAQLNECSLQIQSNDFTTQIFPFNTAQSLTLRPTSRVDESLLFHASYRADAPLLSSLSPCGTQLLTRSFRADPPNLLYTHFTLWDASSGLPLCSPIICLDNAAAENPGPNHAEFSNDGHFLRFAHAKAGNASNLFFQYSLKPDPKKFQALADFTDLLARPSHLSNPQDTFTKAKALQQQLLQP